MKFKDGCFYDLHYKNLLFTDTRLYNECPKFDFVGRTLTRLEKRGIFHRRPPKFWMFQRTCRAAPAEKDSRRDFFCKQAFLPIFVRWQLINDYFVDMGTESEKDLLAKIGTGDQVAFGELLRDYAPLLYTQAFGLLKNEQVAEEVVQDVFIQIWQTREALPGIRNMSSYLFTLSKGISIDALRKMIRERENLVHWQRTQTVEQDVGDNSSNPLQLVDQALQTLSPQQQKVWIMSRRLKMKYEAIAQQLGISKDAVNKYLQTANRKLVAWLQEHHELPGGLATWIILKNII